MTSYQFSSCAECNSPIRKRNKFCNSSCAAKYNNKIRSIESRQKQKDSIRKSAGTIVKSCLNCNTEFKVHRGYQPNKIYCSVKCSSEHKRSLTDLLIRKGEYVSDAKLKKFLIEHRGYSCEMCGISKWQGKDISLEMDHIDGVASNQTLENVRLLCPNCHSQTDTYRNKRRKRLDDPCRVYFSNRERQITQTLKMARSEGLEPPLMLSPPITVTTD